MWSIKHSCCSKCGSTEHKHIARGLCVTCYGKYINLKHTGKKKDRNNINVLTTIEYLQKEYIENEKSICDISREAGCTRQYIYYMLKKHAIPIRKLKVSRGMAIKKGKLYFERVDESGTHSNIILYSTVINDHFFKQWTPEMAYVLGIIYTDGNITPGININPLSKARFTTGRLTISQKDPELLNNVLDLMGCKTKLLYRKRKIYNGIVSGDLHYFHIHSDIIYNDLVAIGLTPNKSLNVKFPIVPKDYIRHFIRGCWDGDGSISEDKHNEGLKASFVSGSYDFIVGMADKLEELGLPKRNIYKYGNTYEFKFVDSSIRKMYKLFYEDVDPIMFMERKYILFRKSISAGI